MPLPPNGTLSLQGYSRPGDTVHSKPKQAMIVRMSAETLEALQVFPQHPQMDFEFGDNPRIYIGDAFFPMRPLKEGTPHELYLRASSAAKPMAPLKLYANVTGKFTVERELGDKVKDKIRETTLEAVKLRSERKTILIDSPADLAPINGKKRKGPSSSMFRKPVQQADHHRSNSTTSSSALPVHTSSSQQLTKDDPIPLRKRLVHCMAVSERTSDEVVKLIVGSDYDTSLRREVLTLLDEVAEQTVPVKKGGDKSPTYWRLKPDSWLEVRPYEWPKLTDPERTAMARSARLALQSLNIPETDPAWRHVIYRNVAHGAPSAGSSRGNAKSKANGASNAATQGGTMTEVPKRGLTSKEAKEKKAKAKADPKVEILMKDESKKLATRVGNTSGKVPDFSNMDEGNRSSQTTTAIRRTPGSGFTLRKSASQDGQLDGLDGPSPPRGKPIDVKDKESPSTSFPAKPTQSIAPPAGRERQSGTVARMKKVKDSGGIDSDREKARDRERERDRERGGERDRERTKDKDEMQSTSMKRKKPPRDGDDYEDSSSKTTVQKRRKTDEGVRRISSSAEPRARDLSLPRKPDLSGSPLRPKIGKKESSPHPATFVKMKNDTSLGSHEKTPSGSGLSSLSQNSSQSHRHTKTKTNGAAKSRRRSPIYTSSEDEGEIRPPSKRDAPSLPTLPNITHPHPHSQPHPHPRVHLSRPLPKDHAGLRARYHSSYLEYIATFQKVATQKGKIESLLKSNRSGSIGSITDSDDELMDTESLAKLNADHRKLQDELESIQRIFLGSGHGGSGSD